MAVMEDNWNYRVDSLNDDNHHDFESRVNNLRDEVFKLNGFRIQNYSYSDGQNHDEELKVLTETNKRLRLEIDTKLEELSRQRSKYEDFKKDQRLLSQEIKDTHEAFLMAKKYYKKYLKIYFTVESKSNGYHTIFLQFFTEAKKDTEIYSIRFLSDIKTGFYTLHETNPKLPNFEELKKKLQDSNDVPCILCCIREAFLKVKKNKHG